MRTSPDQPESRRGRLSSSVSHILRELGLLTVWQSSTDVKLLIAQRFLRLFAYGGSTLVLASYLSALDVSDDRIGLFMTLTLVGDVVISLFLTLFADAMGRKAVFILGSGLMAASGVVLGCLGSFGFFCWRRCLGLLVRGKPSIPYTLLQARIVIEWGQWKRNRPLPRR